MKGQGIKKAVTPSDEKLGVCRLCAAARDVSRVHLTSCVLPARAARAPRGPPINEDAELQIPRPYRYIKKPYVRRYEYTRVLDSQHLKVTQHPTPRPRPSKKSQTFAKQRERHRVPPKRRTAGGTASGTNLYTILTPSSPRGAAITPLPSPLGLPPASLPQHHCHSITWQRRPRRSRSRPGPRRHPPPPCRRGSAPRRRRLPPRVRRRRCSRR